MLRDSTLLNKNFMYKYLNPFFGDGLLTSSADKWKGRRKMLNPCFHFDILKEFIPIFNKHASKLVSNLQQWADGENRELNEPVFHCVMEIVLETILGVNIEAQDKKSTQYANAVKSIENSFMERAVTWWMWPDFIFRFTKTSRTMNDSINFVNEFTSQILQQKMKQFKSRDPEEKTFKRKALLELLLEQLIDFQSISEEDVKEELKTFTAAANDSTAATLNYALYFLGQYKDIQDNAQREVDGIFGDDKERPVEKEDLSKMNYIEYVLKETLRLHPSIPAFNRAISTDITICGYNIPKGSSCVICPYVLHRDPEAFPNPEIFDPTRFFPENCCKRHPFSYIPFSAGPRNCIGQKFATLVSKTILSSILRQFTVESLDQRDTLDLSLELTLKPSTPLKFRLKRRV